MALPALRHLDVSPVEHEGQTLICLRDPDGLVEEQLVLSPLAFFVAASLDGVHDAVDIQKAFARQSGGVLLMSEDIQKVVDCLDQSGFLLTDRFFAIRDQVMEAFAQTDVRPAYMAGKSYPKQPGELRTFLNERWAATDGQAGGPHANAQGDAPPLRGLIVPHIDFERGGPAYIEGYRRLARHGKPDLVFVLGVAHAGAPSPFILTRKDFETPFGVLNTDRDVVDRLAAACSWDPYQYELAHRTEHSIEFQIVMLSYLYGPNVRIVPILCGALGDDPTQVSADSDEEFDEFLSACRAVASATENRVTVVAGADLAHVGRRFGDPFDINDAVIERVRRRDDEDLAFVAAADPVGFYRSVMKDGNQRKVCGLGCIYAALRMLEGAVHHGEILHYDRAPDPAGGIVSFASIALS